MHRSPQFRSFVLFWLPALLSAPVWAQPTLSHALPGAVRPGETVTVTIHGAKLEPPLKAWTSFPANVELGEVNGEKTAVVCKITPEPGRTVGLGGLAIGSPTGVSDVLLLMLDDIPSTAEAANNHSADSAQALTLPAAVDASGDGAAFDYFQFEVAAGQSVSFEVVAARMGSAFDPVVRLLDGEGRQLMLADDDAALGADCRFQFTFPAAGRYLIEVRDNRYQSGGRYRLRIGDFPMVSTAFPLGGRRGSTAQIGFTGPDASAAVPVFLQIPERLSTGSLSVGARLADGHSSTITTLLTSEFPEVLESEPNDSSESATRVTIPCAVNGILQQPGDIDNYEMAILKGQRVTFTAVSRSLGAPAVPFFRLYAADGRVVGESPVTDGTQQSLSYVAPDNGLYRLRVEDLLGQGGAEFAYHVEVVTGGRFSLALKNDKATRDRFVLNPENGAFAVDVQCTRLGYDGPVQLRVAGPDRGVRLFNSVIPEKGKEVKLIVVAPPASVVGDLLPLRIVGESLAGDQRLVAEMDSTAFLNTRLTSLAFPPDWLDGLLLAVTGAPSEPFFATRMDDAIRFSRATGSVQLTITPERKNKDYKDPLLVLVEGLPAGFSSTVKREGEGDKEQYQVTVTGPKDAADGEHLVQIVAYGEFQGKGHALITRLPLVIGP